MKLEGMDILSAVTAPRHHAVMPVKKLTSWRTRQLFKMPFWPRNIQTFSTLGKVIMYQIIRCPKLYKSQKIPSSLHLPLKISICWKPWFTDDILKNFPYERCLRNGFEALLLYHLSKYFGSWNICSISGLYYTAYFSQHHGRDALLSAVSFTAWAVLLSAPKLCTRLIYSALSFSDPLRIVKLSIFSNASSLSFEPSTIILTISMIVLNSSFVIFSTTLLSPFRVIAKLFLLAIYEP